MIGVGLSAALSGGRKSRVNLDPMPALDLNFAANRSLPADYGPTPSFSRASTGTYFNSSGVLTSAAINGPRFDHTYNGTSWVSRGLLVEEQRTNLITYSEQMNSGWTNNNINISANSIIAPDGNQTADNLVPDTVSTNHRLYQGPAGSGSAVFSCFAKSTGYGWLQVRVGAGGGTVVFVNFDVINGTVGNVFASVGASSPAQSIIPVGNGWFRCVFSMTGLPVFTTVIMPRNNNATTEGEAFAGNGTDGIAVWGTQLESGVSFPTSYIPTTSASATRSADVCQITGTDFSSFWNGVEGSFAVEYDRLGFDIAKESEVFQATNSSGTNQFYLNASSYSSGNDYFLYYPGSVAASLVLGPVQPAGTLVKASTAYKVNDFAAARNGGDVVTDSSGSVPVVDRLNLGRDSAAGLFYLNGHIARLRYYPTRLTNAQLQSLST